MYGCARWLLGALITVWGVRAALVGRAGHSVVMPCLYSGRDPIEQLLVYWQLPYQNKHITVLAIIKGKVEDEHQDLRYRGRTYLSPEGLRNWNFTLHLSNLTLTDQGTYNCIVLKAPRAVTEKWQQDVALEVTADFSTPSVTSSVSGKIKPGQEVTLTCRSHGGLHQPRVMWQNSTSGFILDEGHVEYERSGDIVTVISRVSIKVTSSSNVSCSVENKHHNITSQDFFLKIDPLTDPRIDPHSQVRTVVVPVAIVSVVVIIVLSIAAYGLVRKTACAKKYSGVRRGEDGEGHEDPTQCQHWRVTQNDTETEGT